MVRTYKRKTSQGEWTTENMNEAAEKVLTKQLSIRRAAELYNVPFTSLQRRVTLSRGVLKHRGGQPALSEEAEKIFAERLVQLATRGFGLTPKSVRKYAFEYAELQNIRHNFNRQARMAGQDWFHRFLKRNQHLAIRKPEGLSRARMNGMTKEKVSDYFTTLGKVIDDNNLRGKPECIYNVDETGIPLNNRPPNVVTQRGSRDVVSMTSVERGQNVTVLACMNAAGQFIPPFVLFKGVRKRDDFMIGMPSGTQMAMTEKGWITEDSFMQWVHHFNRYRSKGKVILVLDGHACHTNLSVVTLCETLDIELVLMPAHTSHALQPLDVSFFKPLKSYYNQHATAWQHSHPDKGITKVAFGGIFKQAWNQAATVGNATKGFEKTGIYPFNPNAVPDYKFVVDGIAERSTAGQPVDDAIPSTSTQAPDANVQLLPLPLIESSPNPSTQLVDDILPPSSIQPPDVNIISILPPPPIELSTNPDTHVGDDVIPSTMHQPVVNTVEQTLQTPLMQKPKKVPGKSKTQQIKDVLPTTNSIQQPQKVIKEILPSPNKPMDPPKKPRNINRPILHLTSPQNKSNLLLRETKKKENMEKKMSQADKKANKQASKKSSRINKQTQGKENVKKKNKATPKLKVKGTSSSRDWNCIYCLEKFVHPPVEDWIQCHTCEEWCHENCADRGGVKGLYKCELCKTNEN